MLQNAKADKQGLAGVAALIVFIALVLVAAIAATVILDVTGELEQQASNTGDEAEGQLSSTLDIVEVTGNVVNGSEVDGLNITVSVAPGADPVELNDTTIEYTDNNGSVQLTADSNSENSNNASTGNFTIETIVAENGDNNIISSSQDRYNIQIDTTQGDATATTPVTPDLSALEENENVELQFRSGQGGSRFYEFQVPSSLSSRDSSITLG